MRTPADLGAWARAKYARQHASWLGAPDESLALSYPTDPPSEATVAADPAAAGAWVRSWAEWGRRAPEGAEVEWVVRRWRGFGEQRLPVRLQVTTPAALAALAGEGRAWQELCDRGDLLRAAWPDAPGLAGALPGIARKLGRLASGDLPRLVATVDWFRAHPASGLLARQVAVEGVDTKWLERNTDVVRRIVGALTGVDDLGLRVEPRRFRVRVLDPASPADFTAACAQLAALRLAPACTLLVENRDSMVPLADLPGMIAVHAQGLAAPQLAVVPWIAGGRVLYWGDLDTHGMRILGRVREVLPQTESLLMDTDTLTRFAHLAGGEPAPFRGEIGHLTPGETDALRELRAGDRRLEQERIPWDVVTARLHAATASAVDPGHAVPD